MVPPLIRWLGEGSGVVLMTRGASERFSVDRSGVVTQQPLIELEPPTSPIRRTLWAHAPSGVELARVDFLAATLPSRALWRRAADAPWPMPWDPDDMRNGATVVDAS